MVPSKRLSLFVLLMFCFAAIESAPAFAGKLIDAVKARDVALVRSLLAAGEDVKKKVRGDYPLNVASLFGPVETVVALLDAGADIEQPGRDGLHPLHNGVLSGRKDIVALLIQKGAVIDAKDRQGRTPLVSFAAFGGTNNEIAKMLLSAGADPNVEDENLVDALNYAVHVGNVDLGKLLIAAHADMNHGTGIGESALQAAAFHSRYEFAKILIAAGADVNQMDKHGKTPLDYAGDNAAMRELLIDAGAK